MTKPIQNIRPPSPFHLFPSLNRPFWFIGCSSGPFCVSFAPIFFWSSVESTFPTTMTLLNSPSVHLTDLIPSRTDQRHRKESSKPKSDYWIKSIGINQQRHSALNQKHWNKLHSRYEAGVCWNVHRQWLHHEMNGQERETLWGMGKQACGWGGQPSLLIPYELLSEMK